MNAAGPSEQMPPASLNNFWLVMPAYNEAPEIGRTIASVAAYLPRIVVVDDGSCDDTAKLAKEAGALVVRHSFNLGQGASLATGIQYALRRGADYVVTYDADGQHSPEDVEVLFQTCVRSGADIVVGSRFLGGAIDMPNTRRLLLKAATLYTRWTTGLPLTDSHNGLRLLTRKAAQQLRLRQNRMAHASELLGWISASGLKVEEAPVHVRYSEYSLGKGQNFFSSFNILWDLWSSRLHK